MKGFVQDIESLSLSRITIFAGCLTCFSAASAESGAVPSTGLATTAEEEDSGL
jgi:hypothetical protein